jgi:lyso-ornithine lipid O-acyltransferase
VGGLAGLLRQAARIALMLLALLVAVPLYYLWRVLGRRNPWPRRFLGWIAGIAGARVRSLGEPLRDDAILIANHVSWLDIPVLAGASGTAFVAHSGLAENRALKWLCAMNRTVFIARGERARVAEQVGLIRDALRGGGALTIFAEGTTGDGTGLLPFKSSLLSALAPPPAEVRVQPVWLDYGPASADVAWYGDEPGGANFLRLLARPAPLPVAVHFLAPFDPARCGSRKAIAAEARARIEAAMRAARPLPGQG